MTIEDFETSKEFPSSGIINCGNTVSSYTVNACYDTGDLVNGFSYSARSSLHRGENANVFAFSAGTGGVDFATSFIGANQTEAITDIVFTGDIDTFAVGFDVRSFTAKDIGINIYGDSKYGFTSLVQDLVISPSGPGEGRFFVLVSTTRIQRVRMLGGSVPMTHNLQFGNPYPCLNKNKKNKSNKKNKRNKKSSRKKTSNLDNK